MFEQIGTVLSEMIRIPTVSGAGNEEQYRIGEYRECLRKNFPELFAAAKEYPIGEARLLKLTAAGRAGRPVLFTGHMDVVPADGSTWIQEPFSGKIEDGCVWGRGSQDMKGPQCALLSAVNELLKEGWRPEREIWFYLSCDEETGGQTTERAADFLKERGVQFETVFDEGGTICENFMGLLPERAAMFGIAEKGSFEYRFTAYGRGGHAANPPKDSAIVRLAELVTELEETDIFVRRLSEGNRMMLREIARSAETEESCRIALAAEEQEAGYPLLHEICPEADQLLGTTIAFTMIEGGSAFNVMPKKAVLTANVRVSSVEGEKEVTEKLKALAARHDIVCELTGGRDAAPEGGVDGNGYQAMKASVEAVYPGLKVIPFVLAGGTDSRHFLELTDEVLRFSPMYAAPHQGRGVHGENESAYISAVADAARCYYTLLKEHL
ncbi:peptidase dimerization domain protein [Marvinbryantia formatexigens DSM 14469]|uniref:Peptidase dimerization domain protein n=1 Tax=Marvinbryantia formatexigens DSM 14469 TaxID=478749 RepID=C6LJG8_9FIRM|nr:M20/M25/M40 family metallo-hydrolase [Marvinbryantia formatexigens]EET59282.1 peptidase dimerization domain protein [Marvinbryantia formatexigens DSM 14469]UWO25389.1 M20/M25/M40 family metallo-hydrolase [Marvinbryantia formatexigens DSM 14469]SDG73321.1 carboxypeptidase PM20D1 [Marvinbryantia formatexigens]